MVCPTIVGLKCYSKESEAIIMEEEINLSKEEEQKVREIVDALQDHVFKGQLY